MKIKLTSLLLLITIGGSLTLQWFQKTPKGFLEKETAQKADTLLNTKKYLVLGLRGQQIKVVNKSDVAKFSDYEVYSKHKNDVFLIKGEIGKYVTFFAKYIPINDNAYIVEVYNGKLKHPTLPKESYLNNYKENILEQCKAGVNFAGHYTIVSFGCGTACQQNLIINRKTGKIDGEFVTSMGSEFKKDSSLIVENYGAIDEKTLLIELYGRLEVNHLNWNGKELIQLD